jgi:hypothetical protein
LGYLGKAIGEIIFNFEDGKVCGFEEQVAQ